MKPCSTCRVLKDKSDFYRNPYASTGLHSRCKECERAYLRGPGAPVHRARRTRYREGSSDLVAPRAPASSSPYVYAGVPRDAGDGGGLLLAGYVS